MANKTRTRRVHGSAYPRPKQFDGDGPTPCTYCGEPATTIDHIVPISLLAQIDGLSAEVRAEILDQLPSLITVHSCKQCNSVLGNRFFRTLAERRTAVKDYLRRKYGALLTAPDWTDDEIEDLGYTLKAFVRHRRELKESVKERLAWRP